MAYIGRSTDKISNVEVLDNITFDGSSSYTLQKNSVNFTPSSANTLLVSIDGVVQAGNFTVSGSTIDFGTAVAGTSTCDFILHYGVGLITAPSDGTVTTAKLGDSAVTTAKLNDASVSLAKLTATGTKDSTTFLRGDNTFAEAGGGIFESQLLHVRDIKIYATDGGSSVVGTQTRDLNTVETNEISGASLSSNQITLPAGTYFIMATSPSYKTGNSKAVLHNVTRNAVDAVGTAEYSDVSDNVLVRSFINKRFTISVTSVFEIRLFCGAAKATNGLGIGYNVASTNIYTEVMIWKVA